MHRVFPPSEPPDGGRPRFFRPVVVGGTQLRGSWYLSAIVRLQGFSSSNLSHPVLEGKPNANHVRARISNSRTQQLHNMDIVTQCSNSIKKGIIVDYIICRRHPHSLYNKSKCGKEM